MPTASSGTLSDYLEALGPWLAPPLVSEAGHESLLSASRLLPPVAAIAIESRLGGRDARVDLSLGIGRRDGRRAILADAHPRLSLYPSLRMRPGWVALRTLCTTWADSISPLHTQLESLWLELDLDPASTFLPDPSPFLMAAATPVFEKEEAVRGFQTLLAVGVPLLLGQALPAATSEQISQCQAQLPEGAWVRGLGLWLSRNSGSVRLGIARMPHDRLLSYLQAIGWEGDFEAASRLIVLGTRCDLLVEPALDMSDRIASRIGLWFRPIPMRLHTPWYASLIDAFVEENLCTPAERAALLEWPGIVPLAPEQDPWMADVDNLSAFFGRRMRTYLRRFVEAIKVSVHADGSLEAKAYFGYFHQWVGG